MRMSYVIGGLALGAGVVYYLNRRNRPAAEPAPVLAGNHWSRNERLAAGIAGAGLALYGMRSEGKFARAASLAGMGLLARSVQDQPVHKLSDVISPAALLKA